MNILSVQQPAGLLGVFSLVCADKQGFYEEDEDDLLAELAQGHDHFDGVFGSLELSDEFSKLKIIFEDFQQYISHLSCLF